MHALRQVAESVIPHVMPARISAVVLAVGDRYAQYRRHKKSNGQAAVRRLEENLGLTVQRGPFRGMVYPRANAYSRHSIPKLIGSYEEELHPEITRCISDRSYRRYVDIGSAEGYYSVGFAFAAGLPVYAFEIDPFERRYSRLMARANQVEPLFHMEGWCSPEKLVDLCVDRSFILCDCEGYEATLFSADVAGALSHSDLIVELHDVPGMDVTDRIVQCFSRTHQVELITARQRHANDYGELAGLALQEDRFVSEFRHSGQQWAVITARRT
jgi:hypothetical protein